MDDSTLKRFHQKVLKTDTCWLWQGSRFRGGYGQFYFRKKHTTAHRASYVIANGPIPKGLNICHTCDVRHCVNPAHLFAATQKENIADMFNKGRENQSFGSTHINAKLTESNVVQARAEYAAGGISQRKLAQKLGISRGSLQKILDRRSWKHV